MNSDGYDDIIIGAPGFLNNRGRAYIHYGGSNISSVPDFIHTNQSPFRFGDAVSHAGDMDNNGMDDIAISATSLLSRVYVFLTKAGLDLISPTNNSTGLTRNVLFEWGKFNRASKYIFQVSSDSLISNLIVSDTLISDTSRYLQGLALETKYYWRVKAMDSSGNVFSSEIWNFTTIPPIRVSIKAIFEGLYYSLFNILARKDTINLELRNRIYPFDLVDSCIGVIDSLNFTGLFTFNNAPDGKYYLVIKHFQSIETWSKSGGDSLVANGSINHYDFTSSAPQAYGNNLKLKGGKYCLISGDVYQDGFIDGSDLLIIDNDAYTFSTGRFLISDINGDGFADAQDMQLFDNNKSREVIKP
ncbi:MAG: hypothetical protein IPG02_20545 [Ignavibacteria bacterium]|nr:hypothetical protein [Ignavibacteria bacterium]